MPTVDKTASISIKQGLVPTKPYALSLQHTPGGRAAARATSDAAVQHDEMLKFADREVMKW
ncbi:hypothetical protein [Acidovorax carolinensis]|uniref:hypothetical protein n=1 Tax=Acidovorax carolinensis TaxID=553814 RepID=UPI0012FF8118|nr:hypothetical protein [Acidovorax carolinensis]